MTDAPSFAARRPWFLLSLLVVLGDQASKILAHEFLRGRAAVEIVPGFFDLAYSRNRGGLFGYFAQLSDPWRALLLTLLPLLAIVMVTLFIGRGRELDRPSLLGLALILGGAVGNLVDRLLRGEVVDFLDVYAGRGRLADWLQARVGTSHWPTFNIADAAIVVGALLLAFSIVRPRAPGAESLASSDQRSESR
jgi:signal peptidase II